MSNRTAQRPVVRPAPCVKCPFRGDVPIYLRHARREEIRDSIRNGGTFSCHETTSDDTDDDGYDIKVAGPDAQACAGAIKAVLKGGGDTNQIRVMARLGLLDVDALEKSGAEVWDLDLWTIAEEGDTLADTNAEFPEPCSISDPGCIAPAGWLIGGSVQRGTDPADDECVMCGEPVCAACMEDNEYCPMCQEDLDR